MAVTAEIAAYVTSLGDNETWQKLPDGDKANYIIIKKLQEQVINLAGTVQSEKGVPPPQFALILNTVLFIASVHPGLCDYVTTTILPPALQTNNVQNGTKNMEI